MLLWGQSFWFDMSTCPNIRTSLEWCSPNKTIIYWFVESTNNFFLFLVFITVLFQSIQCLNISSMEYDTVIIVTKWFQCEYVCMMIMWLTLSGASMFFFLLFRFIVTAVFFCCCCYLRLWMSTVSESVLSHPKTKCNNTNPKKKRLFLSFFC